MGPNLRRFDGAFSSVVLPVNYSQMMPSRFVRTYRDYLDSTRDASARHQESLLSFVASVDDSVKKELTSANLGQSDPNITPW